MQVTLSLLARLMTQVSLVFDRRIAAAMQIMNLPYAAHKVNQSIEVLDFDRFNHCLRPFFEYIFKFDCFTIEVGSQLFELLGVVSLLFA